MKLLVAGSRTIELRSARGFALLDRMLDDLGMGYADEVIHGGAMGADALGHIWARSLSIPVTVYEADWATHGKRAGVLRNAAMVNECSAALVLWDGKSNGTRNTLDLLVSKGKPHIKATFPALDVNPTIEAWIQAARYQSERDGE